ncbi:MAG: MFS transporter [Deltaproteobacteria bacterium]|nr:MAG: MFS transporter [Deltaproteobacteria bacterium]
MTGSPRPLPALQRVFPELYYGWVISIASSLLSFVCVGIGFYGMTVLLDGLSRADGATRSSVSAATALYFVITAVVGSVVGRLVDRLGARGFIGVGALVMGVGLLLVGSVAQDGRLYTAYAVMSIGFAMCGGVPNSAIVTRWFVHYRARAMTFTHTGVSIGGIVLVPLATWLIQARGLAEATRWLAALLVGVALPVTVFALRSDPRRYGLEPDGGRTPAVENPLLSREAQARHWRPRELLRTRTFWTLALAFASILFCQQAMLLHQLAFLREPLGAHGAALAVSTAAFGSAAARLVIGGIFADRVEKRRLGVALFLVQAVALVAYTIAPRPWLLFPIALVFGFTIGNIYLLQALLAGELFGQVSFGTAFGLLQLITALCGALGPLALGLLFDALGGYAAGLRILAGIAVFAAAVLWSVRPPAAAPSPQVTG